MVRAGFVTCGLGFATRSLRSLVGSLRSHSKESERRDVVSGFERKDMVGMGWGIFERLERRSSAYWVIYDRGNDRDRIFGLRGVKCSSG